MTTLLTKELLKKTHAPDSMISFFERNKLFGLPLSYFGQESSDRDEFFPFLKSHTFISDTEIRYDEPNGYWEKYTFDDNNNKLKEENSNGQWSKYEYDANNNVIKEERSNGNWYSYEYDQNNNMITEMTSGNDWNTSEYDDNNNLIKETDSDGYWNTWEYDANNNLIGEGDSDGTVTVNTTEHRPNGQLKQFNSMFIPYYER